MLAQVLGFTSIDDRGQEGLSWRLTIGPAVRRVSNVIRDNKGRIVETDLVPRNRAAN